ncbi:MAG: DNA repair and recombination protein RadA, partial [Candidatus Aenigmarchaeota archaeon]|nr:DNA repair and recombination protein RadA [Candidatus Aenigmarchaeota archaeon]MDI6721983.1 DNA repair and recombination protein RadA [Candidatus Aenigmarchaeota archaeon]
MLEKFKELIISVFGIETNLRYKRKNITALAIDSVTIGEFLKQFEGLYENAKNKRIPEQIFASPKPVIARFLAALYDCEGCVRLDIEKKRLRESDFGNKKGKIYKYVLSNYTRDIELRSSSLKLIKDCQLLFAKFGINSWWNSDLTKRDGKEFIGYKLHISNKENIEKFHKEIGMYTIRLKPKIEFLLSTYKRSLKQNFNGFLKIKSILPVSTENGKVYDIEVPETHNFLANNLLSHNSGKSQLGFQLAVNVQLPKGEGGLNGKCVFIDTESTFRPERITQIAEARGLDPKKVLKNILVAKAYNSDHQVVLAEKAKDIIKQEGVKIVVIDSMMSHFRSDYSGRGELAPRQQKLNRHLHALQKTADMFNIAIYITNQVMSRPDMMFGDPTAAVGGHILGHACVTGDTLVQLAGGEIKEIRDVQPEKFMSINFSAMKNEIHDADAKFVNRETEEIYEIDT